MTGARPFGRYLEDFEVGQVREFGHYLVERPAKVDYTGVWAAVAIITIVTLVLYALVGILETPVLARFDPQRLNEN